MSNSKKASHQPTEPKNDPATSATLPAEDTDKLTAELVQVKEFLLKSRESELRVMADYQNLVRRTQEERSKLMKFASLSLLEKLLQPMDHFALAKAQLKNPGLDMVYTQFEQVLKSEGLEEVKCLHQPFDLQTMEVIGKKVVENSTQVDQVIEVMAKGYRLQGEVIRHAKVIIGVAEKEE